jgi:hypothetical protein
MGYWGNLVNDVRTHFEPNSNDYQILKVLLLTNKFTVQFKYVI